jgi:hypothetical protein
MPRAGGGAPETRRGSPRRLCSIATARRRRPTAATRQSSNGLIQPKGKILLQIFCRCRTRNRAVQFVVACAPAQSGGRTRVAIGKPQPDNLRRMISGTSWSTFRCRRSSSGCGGVDRLQLEHREARRQPLKGGDRRPFRHREEALHLARIAVEIGFENWGTQALRRSAFQEPGRCARASRRAGGRSLDGAERHALLEAEYVLRVVFGLHLRNRSRLEP